MTPPHNNDPAEGNEGPNPRFNMGDLMRLLSAMGDANLLTPGSSGAAGPALSGLGSSFGSPASLTPEQWMVGSLASTMMPRISPFIDYQSHVNYRNYFFLRYDSDRSAVVLERALYHGLAALDSGIDIDPANDHFVVAQVYQFRFDQSEDIEDIQNSIVHARRALEIAGDCEETEPEKWGKFNRVLGYSLSQLFRRTKERATLEEAIQCEKSILGSEPNDAVVIQCNLNIAARLKLTWETFEDSAARDEAIRILSQLIETEESEEHKHLWAACHNLAGLLSSKFEATGHWRDLEEAIRVAKIGVRYGQCEMFASRYSSLTMLAGLLRNKYEASKAPGDLDSCIDTTLEAVEAVPNHYADCPVFVANYLRLVKEKCALQPPARRSDLFREADAVMKRKLGILGLKLPFISVELGCIASCCYQGSGSMSDFALMMMHANIYSQGWPSNVRLIEGSRELLMSEEEAVRWEERFAAISLLRPADFQRASVILHRKYQAVVGEHGFPQSLRVLDDAAFTIQYNPRRGASRAELFGEAFGRAATRVLEGDEYILPEEQATKLPETAEPAQSVKEEVPESAATSQDPGCDHPCLSRGKAALASSAEDDIWTAITDVRAAVYGTTDPGLTGKLKDMLCELSRKLFNITDDPKSRDKARIYLVDRIMTLEPEKINFDVCQLVAEDFRLLFKATGVSTALQCALMISQKAYMTSVFQRDPFGTGAITLASVLKTRFQRFGDTGDLERAGSIVRRHLSLWTEPQLADRANMAALILRLCAMQFAGTAVAGGAINQAISVLSGLKEKMQDCPDMAAEIFCESHLSTHNNLSIMYMTKYQLEPDITTLRAAVEEGKSAQQLFRALLDQGNVSACENPIMNLANSLLALHRETAEMSYLEEALSSAEEVLLSLGSERLHPLALNDTVDALGLFEYADLKLPGHGYGSFAQTLAADLLQQLPTDDPRRCTVLSRLAKMQGLKMTAAELRTSNVVDLYTQAWRVKSGSVLSRVDAARGALAVLCQQGRLDDAREWVKAILSDIESENLIWHKHFRHQIPLLLGRSGGDFATTALALHLTGPYEPTLPDQGKDDIPAYLASSLGLDYQWPLDATISRTIPWSDSTTAEKDGSPDIPPSTFDWLHHAITGIRLLEMSRNMILGPLLFLRQNNTRLRLSSLELYRQFNTACLELGSSSILGHADNHKVKTSQPAAPINTGANENGSLQKLQACIDEIRHTEGFETFGSFGDITSEGLSSLCADKTLIIVYCSRRIARSGAMIISSKGIHLETLPRLDPTTATSMRDKLTNSTMAWSLRNFAQKNKEMRDVLTWLWNCVVGRVLRHVETPSAQIRTGKPSLPRVHWMGVGVLSHMPFHAATNYDSGAAAAAAAGPSPQESAMSRCVSSYTQNISSLSYAQEAREFPHWGRASSKRMLCVSMAETPGATKLPRVLGEVRDIERTVSARIGHITALEHPSAEAVLKELPLADLVHFACHGVADPHHPMNSHLALRRKNKDHAGSNEWVADPLSLKDVVGALVPSAELAFLSVCSSAEVKDARLRDEAIHVASAFQLAGFKHVVGSLWQTKDDMACEVARAFYDELFGQEADPGGGAAWHWKPWEALHAAVNGCRQKNPSKPLLWAPFVHFGV